MAEVTVAVADGDRAAVVAGRRVGLERGELLAADRRSFLADGGQLQQDRSPIAVSVVHNTVAGSTADLLVGTASPPTVTVASAAKPTGNTVYSRLYALVPPGHNYRVNMSSGAIVVWAELRI